METVFLLITHREKSAWSQFLNEALALLGSLKVVLEEEVSVELLQADYNVVIVDAGAVAEVGSFVSRMRAQRPVLRIVVVSLSPTWQEARAVLRAGAMDYLSRSFTKRELASAIDEVCKIPLGFPGN